jgi:hypothetical protein
VTLSPALMSSADQTWNTPRVILDALAPLGGIALDPCSNPRSIVDAWFSLSLEGGDNGLTADWLELATRAYIESSRSLIYVNSEYGKALPVWLDKCAREAARGCEIVALPPARTDTRWWDGIARTADAVGLWRGRLKFGDAKDSAPFPSALVYWGPRAPLFVESVRPHCTMVWRRDPTFHTPDREAA